jgi:hypothetical protein
MTNVGAFGNLEGMWVDLAQKHVRTRAFVLVVSQIRVLLPSNLLIGNITLTES